MQDRTHIGYADGQNDNQEEMADGIWAGLDIVGTTIHACLYDERMQGRVGSMQASLARADAIDRILAGIQECNLLTMSSDGIYAVRIAMALRGLGCRVAMVSPASLTRQGLLPAAARGAKMAYALACYCATVRGNVPEQVGRNAQRDAGEYQARYMDFLAARSETLTAIIASGGAGRGDVSALPVSLESLSASLVKNDALEVGGIGPDISGPLNGFKDALARYRNRK